MRSSLISKGLLKSHIGRHIPLWVAFAAAWLVFLVLPLALLAPSSTQAAYSFEEMFYAGWSIEYIGSLVGTAIAGIASAICVFDYAFNRDTALFSGSLPIKRSALFTTSYVAGLLPLLAIELVVFVLVALMTIAIPAIGMGYCLAWLALTVGFTFVFYSVAAFCAMLAGTKTAAYYLYLLFLFFVPLLELVLRGVAGSCMWGVELLAEIPLMLWASPLIGMGYYTLSPCAEMWSTVWNIGWGALLIYMAVAAVLVAFSIMLNKCRDLESAGNAVVFKGLAVVAKIVSGIALGSLVAVITIFCMAFSTGGLDDVLGVNQCAILSVTSFLGGFLGVFFGEGLVSGGAGIIKRCWKVGLSVGIVFVLFIAGCGADVLGVKRYVPAVDEVETATVRINGTSTTLTSEDAIEDVAKSHEELLDFEELARDSYGGDAIGISYKLKNGKLVERSYTVPLYVDDDSAYVKPDNVAKVKAANILYSSFCKVCDSREGVADRLAVLTDESYWPISLGVSYGKDGDKVIDFISKDEMRDFIQNAVMKDVEEHGLGKAYDALTGSMVGTLNACTMGGDSSLYRSVDVDLTTENCPNIAKWLKTHRGADIMK